MNSGFPSETESNRTKKEKKHTSEQRKAGIVLQAMNIVNEYIDEYS